MSIIIPGLINNGEISTALLANGSVTADKIGTDAVTSVKILADAVTTAKILNSAVTNAKLANDSITLNSSSVALGSSLTLDTDDIAEGSTNLYYTAGRVDSRIDTAFTAKSTSDLSEGTNLYYTAGRVDSRIGSAIAAADTDSLAEGSSNLYYTDARAISAVQGEATLDLTGVVTVADDLKVVGSAASKNTLIGDLTLSGLYAGHGVDINAGETAWASVILREYVGGAGKPFNAFPNPIIGGEVWGGTPGSEAAVATAKRLFSISGQASYDNGGTIEQPPTAQATVIIDTTENQTSSARGAKLAIQTTPNGATTRVNSMILHGNDTTLINLISSGTVVLSNLPTSDPSAAGQLWNDSGTLKVSAG